MPSQIMASRGAAETDPSKPTPSLETIKEHSSVNQSHQESQY